MQLTKQTDYAFRVLIYLADVANQQGKVVRIPQISKYYGISQHHIAKIVANLGKRGWVSSSRGKGGGITLGVPAEQIKIVDVIRAFETSLVPVNCKEPVCRIAANCRLRGLFDQAMQAFVDSLSEYTLADIALDIDDVVKIID